MLSIKSTLLSDLPPLKKNFYTEEDCVSKRSVEEIRDWRCVHAVMYETLQQEAVLSFVYNRINMSESSNLF